jgi:hypothetical protein
MPHRNDIPDQVPDSLLAGSLITAPAWAPWLAQLNQLLTTASLVIGLALAGSRLWSIYKDRQRRDDDKT